MVAKTVRSGGLLFWKPSQIDWDEKNLINCEPTRSKAGLDRRERCNQTKGERYWTVEGWRVGRFAGFVYASMRERCGKTGPVEDGEKMLLS